MKLTLHVWRQSDADDRGGFKTYELEDVSTHMSFLEMLDGLNEQLQNEGKEPVAFDHDCREAICGTCGFVINGVPHGHMKRNTVCQLHMRTFKDGDHLVLEPWRAKAFPVVRDLIVENHHATMSFDGKMESLLGAASGRYTLVDINTQEADLEEIFLTYYEEVDA